MTCNTCPHWKAEPSRKDAGYCTSKRNPLRGLFLEAGTNHPAAHPCGYR